MTKCGSKEAHAVLNQCIPLIHNEKTVIIGEKKAICKDCYKCIVPYTLVKQNRLYRFETISKYLIKPKSYLKTTTLSNGHKYSVCYHFYKKNYTNPFFKQNKKITTFDKIQLLQKLYLKKLYEILNNNQNKLTYYAYITSKSLHFNFSSNKYTKKYPIFHLIHHIRM
ncbi:hypothetical protein RFI_25687 [Reticulomyxa filosa]|uniref:Uncharacterized protein n=1 Tax=Reticulomyxa filosa TaxID=46433 RepID=X6MCS8_RETFI|nr:hypothetical protein RFI_25687 [Reticulomyxa filosa]|eukprot:ETO11689.1 hypothetical protein RFI_25687 [Reticulomyxa filosa]